MVSYLCKVAGVSRSGYYNYFSISSQEQRKQKNNQDEIVKEIILKALRFRNRKKGARQIKMTLVGHFQVVYNLKRIRRIMKKYEIVCPIRKANSYRRIMQATKEHSIMPNLLNRKFKQGIPGKVLLYRILPIYFMEKVKGHIYQQINRWLRLMNNLAYHMEDNLKLGLAINTLHKLKNNKRSNIKFRCIYSFRSRVHYTSPTFQKVVKGYTLGQSMSRRGNCWDNAVQESFFGDLR